MKRTLIFATLLLLLLCMCGVYAASADFTSSEKTAILNAHNSARASVSPTPSNALSPLEWDDDLASKASVWLGKCLSGPSISNSPIYGENVFSSKLANISVEAVNVWIREGASYDFQNNYCSSGECQHYIQVVSSKSTKVGCARATCAKVINNAQLNGATLIVCNYSPKPNVFDRPFVKSPVCSTPSCGNGVCKAVTLTSAQCVCDSLYTTVNATAPCTACSNSKYTGSKCDSCLVQGMVYPGCLKCSENLIYANGICIQRNPVCPGGCGNGTCLYSSSYTPNCVCSKGYTTLGNNRPCTDCAEGFTLSEDLTSCVRICPQNYFGSECQNYRAPAQCIVPPKSLMISCAEHINYMINTNDIMDQVIAQSPADYQSKMATLLSTKVSSIYKKYYSLLDSAPFKNCGDSCKKSLMRASCLKSFNPCSISNGTLVSSKQLCATTCKNIVTGEVGVSSTIANDFCAPLDSANQTDCFSANSTQIIKCFGLNSENPLVCSSQGKCGATDTCICNQGYTGDKCQYLVCFQKPSTNPSVCSGNGKCIGPDNCFCKEKFSGEQCDIPTCNGRTEAQGGCSYRGTCNNEGKCKCNDNFSGTTCSNCKEGYTGVKCEIPICGQLSANDKNVCGGRGSCVEPNTCKCSDGYTGTNCATFTCDGLSRYDSKVCSKKGKCIAKDQCVCYSNFDNSTFCSSCLPSFSGEYCTTPRCSSDTCNNRGNCTEMKCSCEERFSGPFCQFCAPGYVGSDCSVSCSPSLTCSNRGSCNSDGSCKCSGHAIGNNCSQCASGWYGNKCDFSIVDHFELSEKADIIYGTVYSSIKSIMPCSDLIRPESINAIGKGATCMLNGDSKLTIILGYGSNVYIGQNLTMNVAPQLTTDSIIVSVKQGSYKPKAPEASLTVEKSMLSRGCDKVFLSAANSQSSDRRPLKFAWQVVSAPTTDDSLALSQLISSVSRPNLILDTTNLNNGTYSVQVTVSSPLAPEITSSQTISFVVSEDSIPNLSLREGSSISNTLGTISIITPILSYANRACNKGKGQIKFTYSMSSDFTSVANISSFAVEEGRLIIGPKRSILPVEGDYYLVVTASQNGVQDISLPFKVTAISAALKVSFTVRDVIQSMDDPISLSVLAVDPSKSNQVGSIIIDCLDLDSGLSCTNGSFPMDISSSLKMTQQMDSGVYMFTVTYSKQNRSATDSVKVTLVEISKATVITSSIIPMDGVDLSLINPSKDLVLRAKLIQPTMLSEAKSFLWESSSIELSGIDVSKAYILIPISLLTPGSSNQIKVTIKDTITMFGNETIAKEGTAEAFFTVNAPPTVGELLIEPSTGFALVTDFKISTGNGWTDAQLPLTFEFSTRAPVNNGGVNGWKVVSARSESSSYSLKLGQVGVNEVMVVVYDAQGASSSATTTVYVGEASVDETLSAVNAIADQSNIPVSDGAALIQSILNVNYSQIVNDSQAQQLEETLANVANTVINTMLNNTQQEESITSPTESSVATTSSIIDLATENMDMLSENTTAIVENTLVSSTVGADENSIPMSDETLAQTQTSADSLFTISSVRSLKQKSAEKPTEKLKQIYNALVNIASGQKVPDMPATILVNKDVKAYGRKVTKSFLNGLNETISGKNGFKLSNSFNNLPSLSNVTDSVDISLNVFKPNCTKALTNAVEFIISHGNHAMNISHTEKIADLHVESSNSTSGSSRKLRGGMRSLLSASSAATTYDCLIWDDSVGDYVKDTTCTAQQDADGKYVLTVKKTGTFTVASVSDVNSNDTSNNSNSTDTNNGTINSNATDVNNGTSNSNATNVNNGTSNSNSTDVNNGTNSTSNSTNNQNDNNNGNNVNNNGTNNSTNSTDTNNGNSSNNSTDTNNGTISNNGTSNNGNNTINNTTTTDNSTTNSNQTNNNNGNNVNNGTSSNNSTSDNTNVNNGTISNNSTNNNNNNSNSNSTNNDNSNNSNNGTSPVVNNSTNVVTNTTSNNSTNSNNSTSNSNTTNPVTPVTSGTNTGSVVVTVGGTVSVKTEMALTKAIPIGGALVMTLPSAFTLSESRRLLSDNFVVTSNTGQVIQFTNMNIESGTNKLNATLGQTLSAGSYTITMKVKVNSATTSAPMATIATFTADGSSIETVAAQLPTIVIPIVSAGSSLQVAIYLCSIIATTFVMSLL